MTETRTIARMPPARFPSSSSALGSQPLLGWCRCPFPSREKTQIPLCPGEVVTRQQVHGIKPLPGEGRRIPWRTEEKAGSDASLTQKGGRRADAGAAASPRARRLLRPPGARETNTTSSSQRLRPLCLPWPFSFPHAISKSFFHNIPYKQICNLYIYLFFYIRATCFFFHLSSSS